jgi:hypothetical protein
MDMRGSFSRLRKKLKHPLAKSKRKQDRTEADASGERVDATGSLPRPEPHAVTGGDRDQEGGGANVVEGQVFSADRSLQPDEPEPVPGGESENNQEGEADIDGREVRRMYSHPRPDVEVEVGGGLHRELNTADGEKSERVHLSPSTPSLVSSGKPDGM